MTRHLRKWLSARVGRLARAVVDDRGVAAVEFALIVPLMIVLYAGAVDVTRAVISTRKLNQLARTVSDLVSQQPATSALTPSTIGSIFGAASAIMSPYKTTSLTLTVSAVDIQYDTTNKICCNALVRWSYTQNGTLRACPALSQVANGVAATPTNIPKSLITANANAGYGYTATNSSYLIVTDAQFSYTPIFQQATSWLASSFKKTMWMVPRATSGPIKLASPATAPSSSNGNTGGAICFN